jgi:ADP-ribose pyrophosphatase YjhB (NUDIX family)
VKIKENYVYLSKNIDLVYKDADSFDNLPYEKCQQVYGACFCNGKLVIGFGGRKNDWGLIGGTVEPGEKFEETLEREIQEESNMQVVECWPIGYQHIINEDIYQLRYACAVKSLGEFTGDPAEGIKEIKLIDPNEYKKYFDWGKIGDRIITRAIEIIKLNQEK